MVVVVVVVVGGHINRELSVQGDVFLQSECVAEWTLGRGGR